jgi:hypothetical protein
MQIMTHRLTLDLRRLAFEYHDACVSCGYAFQEGDTSHVGYGDEETPLYVCDKCSPQLKETAVRYYFTSRPYKVPGPNSKLWRYMDFTKYVSLLSTHALYFARADCFDDVFEGAKGIKKNKNRWDAHYSEFFWSAIRNPPPGYSCNLSDEEIEQQARKLLSDLEQGGAANKRRTFISCWHESEHESEAMWRLYSSFLPNAVAVRTTYDRMYRALGRNPSISIGRVQYIDLRSQYAGINDAFWRKHKSFEHEREVRAILIDHECSASGKLIECDLSVLIDEVFVSPKAPAWFVNLVNDVNEKFGVHVSVCNSELLEEPFF